MTTAAVGAKALKVVAGHAQHCLDCGVAAGLVGKGLTLGLGIGLGGVLPIVLWGGGLYIAHYFMKRHMIGDVVMNSD